MVDDDGDGIAGDDDLVRVNAVGERGLALLFFDCARGIGKLGGVVDQRGNAGARAAAGDRDADAGVNGLVGLSPGQGQVDDRVRAFVFDCRLWLGVGRFPAWAV